MKMFAVDVGVVVVMSVGICVNILCVVITID